MNSSSTFYFETKGNGTKAYETRIQFKENRLSFSCSCDPSSKSEKKACTHVINCLDCKENRLTSPEQIDEINRLTSYLASNPLSLLEVLTCERLPREHRYTHFLKSPFEDGHPHWHMKLPKAFNACLDIGQTVRTEEKIKAYAWTQGHLFRFETGQVIYDTLKAYQDWSKALEHINLAIQINTSSSVDDSERYEGHLNATLFKPNEDRTGLLAFGKFDGTQVEFIKFLIEGPTPMQGLETFVQPVALGQRHLFQE